MAEDGTWGVWTNADLAGDPHGWGTYTFDGETLVFTNAEGLCSQRSWFTSGSASSV
jgi:hypothetical protein